MTERVPQLSAPKARDGTAQLEKRFRRAREGTSGELARADVIAHCEGYRVEAVEGSIGFVESVCVGAGREPTLVIRAGLLGGRLLVVPLSSVSFAVPSAQRIWLESPIRILDSRAV